MRGASERSAATAPRGSKTAHADILIILSCPSARRRPAPPGHGGAATIGSLEKNGGINPEAGISCSAI
jgi:hypothetical protein